MKEGPHFLYFFCENHEGRGRKKDLRKKKAFAFFYMKILSSFFPLFSLVPQKSAALPMIFMSGLQLKSHGCFLFFRHLPISGIRKPNTRPTMKISKTANSTVPA